jgi:hypothetical protein
MSVHFPLVNIRKNLQNVWEQILISESITVPLVSPYIIRLKELPDNGIENSKPTITGLTLKTQEQELLL